MVVNSFGSGVLIVDELSVREYCCDNRTVIEPVGEITVLNIRPFREAVARLQGKNGQAVVDLRRTSFIDSAGIEQLILAYQLMGKRDHKLVVLVEPGTQPEHVLEAIALHTFAVLARNASECGLEKR